MSSEFHILCDFGFSFLYVIFWKIAICSSFSFQLRMKSLTFMCQNIKNEANLNRGPASVEENVYMCRYWCLYKFYNDHIIAVSLL